MIHYRNETKGSGLDARRLKRVASTLLKAAGEEGSALSLTLVDDAAIRELNCEHRGKDKATDVLSFPLFPDAEGPERLLGDPSSRSGQANAPERLLGDPSSHSGQANAPERLLGDVVISVDTARRQAAEYDAPLENEIHRLLIHGILHVLGHDHEEAGERARMEAEERRLAAAIGMPWPY